MQPRPPTSRSDSVSRPPPIGPMDVLVVVGLMVLTPLCWLLPPASWPYLGRAGAWLGLVFTRGLRRRFASHVHGVMGSREPALDAGRMQRRLVSRYFEDTMLALRCWRPGRWRPAVQVEGGEHLRRAHAAGRGVVLWISYFHFYNLVSKIGPRQIGFAVAHLSHPRHGFSATRFGMRWLNRVRTSIEDQYLGERVLLGLDSPREALETLRQRLLAGGVVSVTARTTGSKPIHADFLDGRLPCAVGAPLLACQTGAALLPLHTVLRPDGTFLVRIDAPIVFDAAADRDAALQSAACQYARALEPVALAYPDQWQDWLGVARREPGQAVGQR